jgi:hypothetical protein
LVGDKAMARDNFTSGIVRPMILAIVYVVVAIGAATSVGDRQLSRFMQMPVQPGTFALAELEEAEPRSGTLTEISVG